MSQINVDIIESQSTGDVTINDKVKTDEIVNNVGWVSPLVGPIYTRLQMNVNGLVIPKPANTDIGDVTIGPGAGDLLSGNYAENTIVGSGAGTALTFCQNSTYIGSGAGYAATSSETSIVIGRNAGDFLNVGQDNVIIGPRNNAYSPSYPLSAVGAFTGTNNVMIGANVKPSNFAGVNNEITLGNSSHTVLRCAVTTITSLSDKRDKKEIKDLSTGLEFVEALRPVEFIWDDRDEEGKHDVADFGFIAQDLKKAQEDANKADILKLVYESNPDKLEASYGKLIPILVKAIQELSEEVKQLKSK